MTRDDEAQQSSTTSDPAPAGSTPTARNSGRKTVARWAWALLAIVATVAMLANVSIYFATRPRTADTESNPEAVVGKLVAGVQVTEYSALLGNPLMKQRAPEQEFVEWLWRRPTFVVQALVDDLGQVQMYTLTATDLTNSWDASSGTVARCVRWWS